jgi:hypothetical protein
MPDLVDDDIRSSRNGEKWRLVEGRLLPVSPTVSPPAVTSRTAPPSTNAAPDLTSSGATWRHLAELGYSPRNRALRHEAWGGAARVM